MVDLLSSVSLLTRRVRRLDSDLLLLREYPFLRLNVQVSTNMVFDPIASNLV